MPILNFKGKSFVQHHHMAVKYHELLPDAKRSMIGNLSLNSNLLVQGDNLSALKALLPTYSGNVKCIYIDPPYNTGEEGWIYNDNVNSPMIREWLGKVVDKEDLTRHDKWLCMMYPRLKLLQEFLSEDGIIAIQIDDNEYHNLKAIMDEIFNEENYINTICVKMSHLSGMKMSHSDKKIPKIKEYILIYAKNKEKININPVYVPGNWFDVFDRYTKVLIKDGSRNPEEWEVQNLSDFLKENGFEKKKINGKSQYENLAAVEDFCVEHADRIFRTAVNDSLASLPKDNKFYEVTTATGLEKLAYNSEEVLFAETKLQEVDGKLTPVEKIGDIWTDIGINNLHKEGYVEYPNGKKPIKLVKRILQAFTKPDSIVLDSFAGSGTTAHAVLDLNNDDNGNRKFIVIEMEEEVAETITSKRISTAIKSYENREFEFSYYKVGNPIEVGNLLSGKDLPKFEDLARYLYFTSTGEEFNPEKINYENNYIGSSKERDLFLFYKQDKEYLRSTALTLERATQLNEISTRRKIVFAPMKYLDQEYLDMYKIDFVQLPYEIYVNKG